MTSEQQLQTEMIDHLLRRVTRLEAQLYALAESVTAEPAGHIDHRKVVSEIKTVDEE